MDLVSVFDVTPGPIAAVDHVTFTLGRGETLGLVGESGSGKSVTALSILRLLDPPGRIASGAVRFQEHDLLALPESEMRRIRGAGIGLVFQEPMAALNPVMRVGDHIAEALVAHGRASWREGRRQAVDLLAAVRITDPAARARDYPHQLSGGMRQRVMLAVALACKPPLLIADEPTTALDVTVQAQVLDLLRTMKQELQLSLLLITHDLGVVAETADRVAVMYAGRIVESGPVRAIFRTPKHPYTRGLLASMPGSAAAGTRLTAIDGSVPRLWDLPRGCAFAPRCPERMPICDTQPPAAVDVDGQQVRCYLHHQVPGEPHANAPLLQSRA